MNLNICLGETLLSLKTEYSNSSFSIRYSWVVLSTRPLSMANWMN